MTALAILLHLLLGFGAHPAPVVFHQETMANGAVVHCSQYGSCVPFEGNTSEPHTLPGGEVLP